MKLSIITVCYNNLEGLKRTYKSIVVQTVRKEFEWIIIDGNSSDGTKEFLQEHDNEIDYWSSEPDSGIYNAMNKGVKHSKGEYCLFINSGDLLYKPTAIAQSISYLDDGTDIISGNLITYNPINLTKVEYVVPERLTLYDLYTSYIPHPSTFIRTHNLKEHPYDENYKIVSDWIFFCKRNNLQKSIV